MKYFIVGLIALVATSAFAQEIPAFTCKAKIFSGDDQRTGQPTMELPLKAVVRGYSWTVIPITWKNRRFGVAKLKISEMGSRYLFICLYVWLEKTLSRGDYRKRSEMEPSLPAPSGSADRTDPPSSGQTA